MLVYLVIKLICAWRGQRRPDGPEEARRYRRQPEGGEGGLEGPEAYRRCHGRPGGPRGGLEGPEAARRGQRWS